MRVLALAGSLRAASINAAFCRAVARLAPSGIEVVVHPGLGHLPLFNPDLEASLPGPVRDLHAAILCADVVRHGLALYDPQSGRVWYPDDADEVSSEKPWWKAWG